MLLGQDVVVEFNVVKLELEYVRRCIYSSENHLVSLEKQRFGLETAIKDRLEQIGGQRNRLDSLRRNVESERMRLSMELKERMGKVDRLRTR